jgi:hypothetical protein
LLVIVVVVLQHRLALRSLRTLMLTTPGPTRSTERREVGKVGGGGRDDGCAAGSGLAWPLARASRPSTC